MLQTTTGDCKSLCRTVAQLALPLPLFLGCPFSTILTMHLGQLEERGLEARMPALCGGDQCDEQHVLGGEEGQVVGERVGATQPAGAEGTGLEWAEPRLGP